MLQALIHSRSSDPARTGSVLPAMPTLANLIEPVFNTLS
jgi:hypothetical protein